ncbi:biotin-dependent carboxyltransferase family protein [Paenibacillus sp. GCM10028914]|uniref:5-oxoprolinase subunit C family protein n=1 Tax=Paenibacillus sp. GCM10028914 TaxID=3273416 RepID=UPI00360C41D2
MSIKIVKPGLLVTVQDLGRTGYGKYGVVVSGAMDPFSHRAANWLVGNDEKEAALELTWSGFTARFETDLWIAITGGNFSPQIEGVRVPMWRPVFVPRGSMLVFDKPVNGCRSYLAVSGGIDVPEVMGSGSTYMRAGVGGFHGRALKAGDVIRTRPSLFKKHSIDVETPLYAGKWSIPQALFPSYHDHPIVRVIRGNQFDDFDDESRMSIFEQRFFVTPQSDRMGYRLSGKPLSLQTPKEYVSEAVALGTIQVPVDGQPIILMADRQTHGGYPKIAQIASIDIPVVAQVPPGGTLRFSEIALEEAQRIYVEWIHKIQFLHKMIHHKLKEELYA